MTAIAITQQFFIDYLNREAKVLVKIAEAPSDIFIDDDELVFSLEALYSLLSSDINLDFQSFKKELYASTLNQALSELGAKVEIKQGDGKLASNVYCLKRFSAHLFHLPSSQ